jgi:hypothetical protein
MTNVAGLLGLGASLMLIALPAWSAGIRFFDASGVEFVIACAEPASLTSPSSRVAPGNVLLIYTPVQNDVRFVQQMKLLGASPGVAEDLQLLYVIASPAVELRGGYYMRAHEANAAAILPGQFSVKLLSTSCHELLKSRKPITVEQLRRAIRGGEAAPANKRLQGTRRSASLFFAGMVPARP